MKICFLDNTDVSYTSRDIYSNKIRGAENILINLSRELSFLDHQVTVFNNCQNNEKIDQVKWQNIKSIKNIESFDIAITNNDIRLLDKIISNNKIAISHSIQSIEKFIRKGQLISYIKHKPKIVLLGNYHQQNRNRLLRMFGHFTTEWSVDNIFLDYKIDLNKINHNAIFTSNLHRNSDLLIKIWKEYIFKLNKKNKLLITPTNDNLSNFNIFPRKFGTKNELLNDLACSRIMLIPGHKAELFCISAEEAKKMCVPIITLGLGCLNERVEHGKSGFIANNYDEFANYTNILFNDDDLWLDMRKNLFNQRNSSNWSKIAKKFIDNATR